MEKMIEWGSSVCIFAVIVVLYKIMFPQGNIKKAGEILMILLMLLVMLQPFTHLDIDADTLLSKADWYDSTENTESNTYDTALEQVIRATLAENGIEVEKIQLNTETDTDNYLILTTLKLKTDADADVICTCLKEKLGIPEEIVEIDR